MFTDLIRRHTSRGLAVPLLLSVGLALAACSATAPFSVAPKLPRPSAAPASAPPPAADRPIALSRDAPPRPPPAATSHRKRQYFDQKRRRYYYYDPGLKKYFWEDGTPK